MAPLPTLMAGFPKDYYAIHKVEKCLTGVGGCLHVLYHLPAQQETQKAAGHGAFQTLGGCRLAAVVCLSFIVG